MRNLKSKIPGAPNFTYGELIKSATALRLGIDNTPNEDQWVCLEKLAVNVLQPVRDKFGGIRITSGFRSVALCEVIGSKSTSNHTRGQASDIEPIDSAVGFMDIINWVYYNLEYRNLIAEYVPDNGWVHVDYRVGANIKVLKVKDKVHNYEEISLIKLNQLYGYNI